ncbi:MAG: ATP-binding protein [Bacteroidota bacterium]|nr:ATP-binding protein [Bacteroidota bacterium]
MNLNDDNKKMEAELINVNKKLVAQIIEREKREAELIIANKELIFQNKEKEKKAAELIIANRELLYQNREKEKRAAELVIANVELVFQNSEKEKRAAELVIANVELVFQNGEKEKRAAELVIANIELIYQNAEKEKRAAELVIANLELDFQNREKEKRAIELNTANDQLSSLSNVNKELESFAYIASHDLQEPLRKIQIYTDRIVEKEHDTLSISAKEYFQRIQNEAKRMKLLITDILAFSQLNTEERIFVNTDLNILTQEIITEFKETIETKKAIVEAHVMGKQNIIPYQFRQLLFNLISNSLKFSNPEITPHVKIKSSTIKYSKPTDANFTTGKTYYHISVSDNGIGFEQQYSDKIFEVFQRLNGKSAFRGTGIGLAIVKKIVENHNGIITATSELNKGTTFDIYIPVA